MQRRITPHLDVNSIKHKSPYFGFIAGMYPSDGSGCWCVLLLFSNHELPPLVLGNEGEALECASNSQMNTQGFPSLLFL